MKTDYDRFMAQVDTSGGPDACHLWTGPTWHGKEYGRFYAGGKSWKAHRWLLGHLRGAHLYYPDEETCHRCDNPPCVNRRHLYVGDRLRNAADMVERSRSLSPAAELNKAKTHCKDGHAYSPQNTYRWPPSRRRPSGKRVCKTCQRRWSAVYRSRRREVASDEDRSDMGPPQRQLDVGLVP